MLPLHHLGSPEPGIYILHLIKRIITYKMAINSYNIIRCQTNTELINIYLQISNLLILLLDIILEYNLL